MLADPTGPNKRFMQHCALVPGSIKPVETEGLKVGVLVGVPLIGGLAGVPLVQP